jgi:hypothetical protein
MKIVAVCALACVLALQGCATSTRGPDGATPFHIVSGFKRPHAGALIVVVPSRTGINQHDYANAIVMRELVAQLKAAGQKVSEVDHPANHKVLVGPAMRQLVEQLGGEIDPATDKLRVEVLARTDYVMGQRVAIDTGAVLIIRPRLSVERAWLKEGNAHWHGQQMPVDLSTAIIGGTEGKPEVTAISVDLTGVSAEGYNVFQLAGGVKLPKRSDIEDGQIRIRDDMFTEAELADAVRVALRPLLLLP